MRDGLYYKKFTDITFSGITKGRTQATYANGKKHGSCRVYHNNGQLHEIGNYQYNSKEGQWLVYDENGLISKNRNYKNNLLHGRTQFFYRDIKTFDGYYYEGKKHGKIEGYWEPEGTLQYQSTYEHGKKIGSHKKFSLDGITIIKLREFIPNTDNSIYTSYYEDGISVLVNGTLEGSYPSGIWREFHHTTQGGGAMYEGTYKDGKRVGIWKSFLTNGNIQCKRYYSNSGFEISIEVFDEEGLLRAFKDNIDKRSFCYGTRLWESDHN